MGLPLPGSRVSERPSDWSGPKSTWLWRKSAAHDLMRFTRGICAAQVLLTLISQTGGKILVSTLERRYPSLNLLTTSAFDDVTLDKEST